MNEVFPREFIAQHRPHIAAFRAAITLLAEREISAAELATLRGRITIMRGKDADFYSQWDDEGIAKIILAADVASAAVEHTD